MRIKLLKNYEDHKKGDIVPVDDKDGQKFIDFGVAEKVADPSPLENLSELIADGLAKGLAKHDTKAFGGKHPASVNITAEQSPEDKRKSLAEQVRLITMAQCNNLFPGKQQAANETLEKVYGSTCGRFQQKDLAEDAGTTGGYTVAPLYAKELLQLAAEQSIVRPYANVKQLPGKEAYYPMLNQTFTPAGTQNSPQSAYWGGVQVSWLAEAVAGTATEPNWKQVHISTNELQCLTAVSKFLIDDSFLSIDSELRQLFSGAMAWAEDFAFLQGNGAGKPLGVLNAPATITYATRATANTFKLADAANMAGAMMPQSRNKAVWIATNNLYAPLVQLLDASGRVTFINNVGSGYSQADLMKGQMGIMLLGRPVIFTEKLPALGTAGDIILADWSKYIVADTGTLMIAASDQYAFNKNQIVYRTIGRVDGQPQIDAPFVQQDGTTKISPFVLLSATGA